MKRITSVLLRDRDGNVTPHSVNISAMWPYVEIDGHVWRRVGFRDDGTWIMDTSEPPHHDAVTLMLSGPDGDIGPYRHPGTTYPDAVTVEGVRYQHVGKRAHDGQQEYRSTHAE